MLAAHRPFIPFALTITALAARPLVAQCPDGSPPPCRAAAAAPPARVAMDANVIAIFPFRVTGASADAASLREGAMDLMSLALDEQAGLRVVNSRTLMARARNFTDATPVADAAAVARSLGAGTMILGNAVVVGTQVRARAELHDLMRTTRPVSVEARGTSTDPAPIIDSLASALARLRLTAGAATWRSVSEFSSTSPPALRLYLAGESLERLGRWQEAADSLLRAIDLDSTFVLAYYRLRVATSFGATLPPGRSSVIPASAMATARLPRRQSDLLAAARARVEGRGHDAVLAADALGARYPDDPEAAYEQGEGYFHLGLNIGEPPSRALEAYDRAIRLDSTFIDPYNHATELKVMTGDSTGALRLARRGVALAPTSGVHLATLLAARAVAGHEDPAALSAETRRRGTDIMESTDVLNRAALEVLRMSNYDPGRALQLADAFATAAAAPDRGFNVRHTNLELHAALLANMGRFGEVRATLAAAAEVDDGVTGRTGLVLALLSGQGLDDARAELQRGDNATDTRALALDLLALIRGGSSLSESDLRLYDEAVARRPASESYTWAATRSALRGLGALARGDSAGARTLLMSAADHTGSAIFPNRFHEVFPWAMLALARLEMASVEFDNTYRRLAYTALTAGPVPLRAEFEQLRGQLEERRGNRAAAARAYRNVISIWENGDAAVQPHVAEARAAVARLEGR